jgi:tetratricopeptide (TPR) repeat protein
VNLIQRVVLQADGNPFYAEEILNYLHDRDIDLHEDLAIETLDVPTSLQSLILSRIDQLMTRQQLTLKVASIIGRLFRFDHLHGYYPELGSTESLRSDLDFLARIDLTPLETPEPELTYLFRHIITQEVAYTTLPAATRAILHEHYAGYLEERSKSDISPFLDLLAYHYERSGNLPKKLEYLHRAADAAVAHFSNEDAIQYYRRALTILENTRRQESDLDLSAVMGEKLGNILHLITRYEEARIAFRTALMFVPTVNSIMRARLTCKIANTLRDQHDFEDSLNVYSEALYMLGNLSQTAPRLRCLAHGSETALKVEAAKWQCWIQIHLEMLNVYYWLGRLPQSEETFQKIKSAVEQYGTPAQRASLFRSIGAYSIRRDRYYFSSDAIANYRAALEAYQQAGIHENIPAAQFQYGFSLLFSGELDLAEDKIISALQLADQRGDLSLQARCLTYLTIIYRKKGEVEKVEPYAEQSLSRATAARMPEYAGAAMANRAWVAWRRGDYRATKEYSTAAISIWERSPAIQGAAYFLYWTAIWPLVGVELLDNDLSEAVKYTRLMLEPNQAGMPDELATILREASVAWESGQMETVGQLLNIAFVQAEKYRYI